MSIFGRNKKPADKRTYRKPTDEEIEKKESRKEKQLARTKFYELAKHDPELEKTWISKQMGIDINSIDPVEKERRAITTEITKLALEQIKKDPALTKKFVDSQVESIIGGTEEGREDGQLYGEGGGSIIRQALEELNDVEEFRDRLGVGKGKGGITGILSDPDVVKEIVVTLRSIMMRGGAPPPEEKTIIVSVNGEVREVSLSEYKKLLQQGVVKPVAALIPPEKETPEEEPVGEEPLVEEPVDISQFLSLVDLDILISKLEYTPEAYVLELQDEKETDAQAQFVWGILSKTTLEEAVEKVTPYGANEELAPYIAKLLSEEGKTWLAEVIRIIKELEVEET